MKFQSLTSNGNLVPNRSRLLSSSLLIVFFILAAGAQQKSNDLREWVGKYPSYNNTKPPKDFLKLPQIRKSLLKILPKKDLYFLTVTCGKETPIKLIEDYLIVHKCHSNYCLRGTALTIINLKDNAMYVAITNEQYSETRWFSTTGKIGEFPFDVKLGWIITEK